GPPARPAGWGTPARTAGRAVRSPAARRSAPPRRPAGRAPAPASPATATSSHVVHPGREPVALTGDGGDPLRAHRVVAERAPQLRDPVVHRPGADREIES